MIRFRTLASAMLAAFGAFGVRSAAAAAITPRNDATVVSLSVVPRTGRADVVVRVDGSVSFKHFTLNKPDKIVVDLSGATLGLPDGDAYDGMARGGITRIRYSQFTRTVVRIVLTLDAAHPYAVTNENGGLRISVEGASPEFSPWAVGAKREEGSGKRETTPTESAKVDNAQARPVDLASVKVEPKTEPAKEIDTKPLAKPVSAKPLVSQQSQENRITYNPENAPIADVLAAFSAFTGRTILPSKNVTG